MIEDNIEFNHNKSLSYLLLNAIHSLALKQELSDEFKLYFMNEFTQINTTGWKFQELICIINQFIEIFGDHSELSILSNLLLE